MDSSPVQNAQIASEGLFSEKTHSSNAEDFESDTKDTKESFVEDISYKQSMADEDGQSCSPKLYEAQESDVDPGEISRDAPDGTLDGMVHFLEFCYIPRVCIYVHLQWLWIHSYFDFPLFCYVFDPLIFYSQTGFL